MIMERRQGRPRVGLKELNTLNQIFEFSQPEMGTGKRISTRIRFKNKLKAYSSINPRTTVLSPHSTSGSLEEMIRLVSSSIEDRNPADQILLMRVLGLTPKEKQETHSQPNSCAKTVDPINNVAVQIKEDGESKNNSIILGNEDPLDLDLEVVFCPLDIPDIYEEIMKKPFPTSKSMNSSIRSVPTYQETDSYQNSVQIVPDIQLNQEVTRELPVQSIPSQNLSNDPHVKENLRISDDHSFQNQGCEKWSYFDTIKRKLGQLGTDLEFVGSDRKHKKIMRLT